MAQFRFKGPDGQTYAVNAPEGATAEQAFGVLQGQLANQPAGSNIQRPHTEGPLEQSSGFLEQAGETAMNVGKGALAGATRLGANLLPVGSAFMPGTTYTMPRALEMRQRAMESARGLQEDTGIAGTIGEVGADIAGTAGLGVPRFIASAGARLLPKALTRFGMPAKAATEGAVGGAATSEDPSTGAAWGAAGGVAGQQIGQRAAKFLSNPTRAGESYNPARILMDEGVELTAGQAANPNTFGGRLLRMMEEGASVLPGVGSAIQRRQETARQAFRDRPLESLAERARIPGPPGRDVGDYSARQLQDIVGGNFGQAYDDALGVVGGQSTKTIRPTGVLVRNIDNIINDPRLGLTPQERMKLRTQVEGHIYDKMMDPAGNVLSRAVPLDQIFKAQSKLAAMGRQAAGNPVTADYGAALGQVANEIYQFIGRRMPATGRRLEELRGPYREFSTLEAAANKAGISGEFNPKQFGNVAMKRNDQALGAWAGLGEPLLPKASTASNYMKAAAAMGVPMLFGGSGLGIPMYAGLGLGFGTKTGQKFLTGRAGWQEALAEAMQRDPFRVGGKTALMGRVLANEFTEE